MDVHIGAFSSDFWYPGIKYRDKLIVEELILIATRSLIGEGFDYPCLDTLIMATPVSFRSVVEQYAGRLNRDYEGKRNVIVYDYVDSHIPMFDDMYAKRLRERQTMRVMSRGIAAELMEITFGITKEQKNPRPA